MKSLHLTRQQAFNLAQKLEVLCLTTESIVRKSDFVFSSFELKFSDIAQEEPDADSSIEIHPTATVFEVKAEADDV